GARDRLIAESGEAERYQVVDRRRAALDQWRLGDEPLGAPRHLAGLPVAPEVIAGLAGRQVDRVASGVSALGIRPAEAREHQEARHIDMAELRDAADDVVH